MITVKKGKIQTQIMEQFKGKYLSNGWEIVGAPTVKPKTEEVAIVAENLQAEQAAHERGTNATADPVAQAEAIVKAETKPRARKTLDTGLIKSKEEAAK